jgi:hypothetical protein
MPEIAENIVKNTNGIRPKIVDFDVLVGVSEKKTIKRS